MTLDEKVAKFKELLGECSIIDKSTNEKYKLADVLKELTDQLSNTTHQDEELSHDKA